MIGMHIIVRWFIDWKEDVLYSFLFIVSYKYVLKQNFLV